MVKKATKKVQKQTQTRVPQKNESFLKTGLVFLGCFLIGFGLGNILGATFGGMLIGAGVGFILMFWFSNSKKK